MLSNVGFKTVGSRLIAQAGPFDGGPPGIGLVIDNTFLRTISLPDPDADGHYVVDVTPPDHILADTLDLVDIATGRSILAHPYDLWGFHEFRVVEINVSHGEVTGRFVANGLADAVWVTMLGNEGLPAQGFARRDETGEFSFRLPLLSVVVPNLPLILTPRIAGKTLGDNPISISTAEIGFVGFVDKIGAGIISGWAINLDRPERVTLNLEIDGEVVETVVADQQRDDLRDAGVSDGFSAFTFILGDNPKYQKSRRASVVVDGTKLELINSPFVIEPPNPMRGYFDRMHGLSLHGWASNMFDPKTPVIVEAVCEGRVIGSAPAKLFRGDLLDAGLNDGLCAFKIDVGSQLLDLFGKDVFVRIAGTDLVLNGSPKVVTQNANLVRYLRPNRDVPPAVLPRLKRMMNHRAGKRVLSIIMPVYNPPREWMIQALESVRQQWCDRWELICVNDCSTAAHVAPVLAAYAKADRRIRILNSVQNVGIAKATNLGLRAANGDYVTFMDHDDYLEPDAAYHLLRASYTGADMIYSDEATTDENINSIAEVKARPAFSYDYYLSHPYFVHMICVRREIAYQVAGWDESMAISADVDFVLRVLTVAQSVTHVPRVLYRWRTHETSTGHSKKDRVMAATRGAIQRHLDARGTGATVEDGVWFNQFRINWPASPDKILIVIPTKNKADLVRTAIESVERTSNPADYRLVLVDHQSDQPESVAYFKEVAERHTVMPYEGEFNYSRMNNVAVAKHGGDCKFVLFLNNDIEALQDGWLDRMRRLANCADVGAVGALLLYPDKRIQHAGVILGFNGSAEATFKFENAYLDDKGTRNLGFNCSITSVRDYSAVTAACLMMRREVFEGINGFDEKLKVGFNDVDLCLRVCEAGFKVLYDGSTILFHYESATRSQTKQVTHPEDTDRLLMRHAGILTNGDPYYNPNLSDITQDHTLREDPGCKRFQDRVTSMAPIELRRLPAGAAAGPARKLAGAGAKPMRKRKRSNEQTADATVESAD